MTQTLQELHAKLMEGMSEEEKQAFKDGLKELNLGDPDKDALRESFRQLRPDFTERQLDIVIDEAVSDTKRDDSVLVGQLAVAVRDEFPGLSDSAISKWVQDRLQRALDMGGEPRTIVRNLIAEDKEAEETQAMLDAVAELYPKLSKRQCKEWLTKHELLLVSFKALKPEMDARQLVRAVSEEQDITSGTLPWDGK